MPNPPQFPTVDQIRDRLQQLHAEHDWSGSLPPDESRTMPVRLHVHTDGWSMENTDELPLEGISIVDELEPDTSDFDRIADIMLHEALAHWMEQEPPLLAKAARNLSENVYQIAISLDHDEAKEYFDDSMELMRAVIDVAAILNNLNHEWDGEWIDVCEHLADRISNGKVTTEADVRRAIHVMRNLQPGQQLMWTDPDDCRCSRILMIAQVSRQSGGVIHITEKDGSEVECFIDELS